MKIYLHFTKGSGKINMVYSGSLEQNYDSLRMIHGNFNMDSASIILCTQKFIIYQRKRDCSFYR